MFDPRLIPSSKCLPMVRYGGRLFKIVGRRMAKPFSSESGTYCDLWLDNGSMFRGADIIDVPMGAVEEVPEEKNKIGCNED